MIPRVLIFISGDPRTNPRSAEAIRIAAGVGVWKKTEISVYLHGDAVLALSEYADGLADEENYVRYLPILAGFGRPIYAQKDAPLLKETGRAALPYQEITGDELAALCARQTCVIHF